MLYGTIFTDSHEFYTCTLEKAMTRFKMVTAITLNRAIAIRDTLATAGTDACVGLYTTPTATMGNWLTSADTTPGFFNTLANQMSWVRRDNEDLVREDCPLIY